MKLTMYNFFSKIIASVLKITRTVAMNTPCMYAIFDKILVNCIIRQKRKADQI